MSYFDTVLYYNTTSKICQPLFYNIIRLA